MAKTLFIKTENQIERNFVLLFIGIEKNIIFATKELFDSIAPQNAENRTVANSLPLFFKYSVKCLFLKRLCQAVENLK